MWHSPILHYILEEELGVSSAVTSGGAAIKVPYFKNRSTTTIILPHPSEFGKGMCDKTMEHSPDWSLGTVPRDEREKADQRAF
ncbi:hypothetical protein Tco_0150635 [Tanacetum coccineum]